MKNYIIFVFATCLTFVLKGQKETVFIYKLDEDSKEWVICSKQVFEDEREVYYENFEFNFKRELKILSENVSLKIIKTDTIKVLEEKNEKDMLIDYLELIGEDTIVWKHFSYFDDFKLKELIVKSNGISSIPSNKLVKYSYGNNNSSTELIYENNELIDSLVTSRDTIFLGKEKLILKHEKGSDFERVVRKRLNEKGKIVSLITDSYAGKELLSSHSIIFDNKERVIKETIYSRGAYEETFFSNKNKKIDFFTTYSWSKEIGELSKESFKKVIQKR